MSSKADDPKPSCNMIPDISKLFDGLKSYQPYPLKIVTLFLMFHGHSVTKLTRLESGALKGPPKMCLCVLQPMVTSKFSQAKDKTSSCTSERNKSLRTVLSENLPYLRNAACRFFFSYFNFAIFNFGNWTRKGCCKGYGDLLLKTYTV